MLPSIFISKISVSQSAPKRGFCGRLRMAHFAGALQKRWINTMTGFHKFIHNPLSLKGRG